MTHFLAILGFLAETKVRSARERAAFMSTFGAKT